MPTLKQLQKYPVNTRLDIRAPRHGGYYGARKRSNGKWYAWNNANQTIDNVSSDTLASLVAVAHTVWVDDTVCE